MSDAEHRLKNQTSMLAEIAHDLRHSLFRIGLASDLVKTEGDHDVRDRYLYMLAEAITSMTKLVEDLEDYGCLQDGRLRLAPDRIDPAELVDVATRAFEPVARLRAIRCSIQIDGPMRRVTGDRQRLLQVLANLIGNALCSTPSGGDVVVGAYAENDAIRFSVADTGPGLDPSELGALFERYKRGARACYLGRGLGLAIAHELVTQHAGRIWAENALSGGAVFSFTVPYGQ